MDIKTLIIIIKKILPPTLIQVVRKIGGAALTPFVFSFRTGHYKSALLSRAVNKYGNPIPWYTYPIIDFLSQKDFSKKSVLEWGTGQSTLWWSFIAKDVMSFEANPDYYKKYKKACSGNCAIYLTSNEINDTDQYFQNKKFDIIVIDGLDRYKCAIKSVELLNEDGAIILDDSEVYWGGEERGHHIPDFFRQKGFHRVDFFGYVPGNIQPQCTSVFFNKDCFLFKGLENVNLDI